MASGGNESADFRLEIAGTTLDLQCATDENGSKIWNEGIAPMAVDQFRTDPYSLEHTPPEIDTVFVTETWAGGLGWEQATGTGPFSVYNYTNALDASWPGRIYRSLEKRTSTGVSGTAVRFFSGQRGEFALVATSIYQWSTSLDIWVEVDDAATDGEAYTDLAELNGVMYAARGQSADYKYSTDGSTWTAFTDSDNNFDFFEVRDNVLWGLKTGSGGMAVLNTTNGQNSGVSWSAADTVGDTGQSAANFLEADNNLYVFKENGFGRYTGSAWQEVFKAEFRNGRNGNAVFRDADGLVYFNFADKLLAFDPLGDTTIAQVYPQAHMEGNEDVTGRIIALAGDLQNLYLAVRARDNIIRILKRVGDVWHATGITASGMGSGDMHVIAGGRFHETNPVLVFGESTGITYVVLPLENATPATDPSVTFTTSNGVIYGPWIRAGSQTAKKFLNSIDSETRNTTSERTWAFFYQADDEAAVSLGVVSQNGTTTHEVTSEVEFIRIRYAVTDIAGVKEESQELHSLALHATQNPRRRRMWQPTVLLADEKVAREGARGKIGARIAKDLLLDSTGRRVTLTDREGNTFLARVIDAQVVGLQGVANGHDEYSVSLTIVAIAQTGIGSIGAFSWGESSWGRGRVYRTA